MMHDILHCNYEGCPAKERCRRYAVYLEDKNHDIPYCTYWLLNEDDKERIKRLGSCPNFWEYSIIKTTER